MSQHHQAQWSNIVVERKVGWEDGQNDMAVLLIPKFRKWPLAKWLQPRLKKPHIRVKLDEIGSFVWKQLDGRKTFALIAQAMREHFGEKAEPAEDRLKKFLLTLRNNKFVELYQPAPEASS